MNPNLDGVNRDLESFEKIHGSLVKALDEAGIGIDVIDKSYVVKYQNKFIIEKYGDLRGKLCYKGYMGRDSPCESCTMEKAIQSKTTEIMEIVDPKGSYYQLISSPISEENGVISEVVHLIIDITQNKNLEENLIKNERLLRETFENAPDAIFWADIHSGEIINCNKRAEILLERNTGEIIGMPQIHLHPPEKRDFYLDMFKRHIEAENPSEDEAEIITKSGNRIPVHISVSKITINGKSFMQGIFRDMREQKRKLEQIKFLTSAITQTNEGIAVSDLRGNLKFVNKAFALMHGYISEDLMGKNISMFHNEDQIPIVDIANLKTKKEGYFKGEIWHKRKDVTIFPTLTTSTLLKDDLNNPIGTIAVIKEISELKKAETELKQSREKFRTAFKKAEFLRDIFSHDVNNIFQSILSAAEFIKILCEDKDKHEDVVRNLMIIENQIIRGKTLISNIRKLTKLDSSVIKIFSVNIFECLEKSIEFIKTLFDDKKIYISTHSPFNKLYVKANNLLYDIFNNLLINAVEYNENPNIEIIVNISRTQEEKYIKVEVIDNAMGIPDEYKGKLQPGEEISYIEALGRKKITRV